MKEFIIKKKYSSPLPPIYLVSLFMVKLVEVLCMYKKIQICVSETLFHPNGGIFYKLFFFFFSHLMTANRSILIIWGVGRELWGISLCRRILLCRCTRVYLIHTTLVDIKLLKHLAITNNNVVNNHVSLVSSASISKSYIPWCRFARINS